MHAIATFPADNQCGNTSAHWFQQGYHGGGDKEPPNNAQSPGQEVKYNIGHPAGK